MPTLFTEMGEPTKLSHRQMNYEGERYHFCSEACCDIFKHEPEKYVQAWLPVHQIYQGNCEGGDVETVVQKYYHINIGEDNFEYVGSPDHKRWLSIKGKSSDDKAEGSKQDAA